MFKINDETKLIEITRGDIGGINLSVEDYTFKTNDTIQLNIYNARRMNRPPVFTKEWVVTEATETFNIQLSSQDTKFGEMKSRPIDYWYEIQLNGNQTIIGFDDEKNEDSKKGEKIFRLYPEGYLGEV